MRSHSRTTLKPGARIFAVALSALALVMPTAVHAQERAKGDADAAFLAQVVPSIAASVTIIDYAVKNGSDRQVRQFAERVLKQHKESVATASAHAKRLDIAVDTKGQEQSKRTMDAFSKLKGPELDVAFLEWLSHIHHDATVFENEVTNGVDPELKAYAKGSITAGNEHLDEARALLARLKK